jgi:predicted Fe-S protein YdhL (DUF1289 family)
MALYPKIQSPCPYKNNLAAIMDGDMCRACKRQVFDLSGMSDDQRVAFIRGCKDEVCVSYKFPVRPAIAAAAIAAAVIAVPTAAAACSDETEVMTVIVGGIKDPAHVKFVENPGDKAIPELPIVYEPAAHAQDKPKSDADKQAQVNSRA